MVATSYIYSIKVCNTLQKKAKRYLIYIERNYIESRRHLNALVFGSMNIARGLWKKVTPEFFKNI